MVTNDQFRTAMSKFATGVTVITTIDEKGDPHEMTANSFTSVCLEPPTILVCAAHSTNSFGYLDQNKKFGVNILGSDQQELGAYFAKRPEQQDGSAVYSYTYGITGLPILEGSILFMGCKVVGEHLYGDHTIFVAEVEELTVPSDEDPLMFFNSRWYDPSSK
tara:strand:- start:64 stop:549 length:486 start_codon:yes stop_codon:yes gene_type:complete